MSSKTYLAVTLSLLLALSLAVTGARADAGGPLPEPPISPFVVSGDAGLIQNAVDPTAAGGLSPTATYTGQVSNQASWMPDDGYGNNLPATFNVYTQVGANGQAQVILIPDQVTATAAMQHPDQAGVTNAGAVLTNAYNASNNYGSAYSQYLINQNQNSVSPALQGWTCSSSSCFQSSGYNQAVANMAVLNNTNGAQQINLTQAQALQLAQNLGVYGYSSNANNPNLCGWQGCAAGSGQAVSGGLSWDSAGGTFAMLMIYTQSNCAFAGPGVCGMLAAAQAQAAAAAAAAAGLPDPSLPTSAPECHAPVVRVGKISASATKIAPNFPLVIGQDETLRGADVTYSVTVEPTSYTTWSAVPQYTDLRECNEKTGKCSTTKVFTGWKCVSNVTWYPESVTSAHAGASLSQKSREWIESGDLQIHYPGAYLHHPDFGLGGGGGGFQGNTYVWSLDGNLQVADPGEFNLEISGRTSGTPVHAGRSFSGGGTFLVYLREVVIIK